MLFLSVQIKKGLTMFQGIITQNNDPGFKIIELCHYNESGNDYYVFATVEPEKYPVFKKACRKGEDINIKGVDIIYKGKGKVPTLDVIREVTEKYEISKEITNPVVRRAMSSINTLEKTERARRTA
mgnify:CR=1 FL=1